MEERMKIPAVPLIVDPGRSEVQWQRPQKYVLMAHWVTD